MGGGEKRFSNILPSDSFIILPREHSVKEIYDSLNTIVHYIKNGGLVIFYPSAGVENHDNFEFKSGLSYLFENLSLNTMVYSFVFNVDDARAVKINTSSHKLRRVISTLTGKPKLDFIDLHIQERMSKVGDWPFLDMNSIQGRFSQAQRDFYCKQFGINPFDLSNKK